MQEKDETQELPITTIDPSGSIDPLTESYRFDLRALMESIDARLAAIEATIHNAILSSPAAGDDSGSDVLADRQDEEEEG